MRRMILLTLICFAGTVLSAREYAPGDHELVFMPTAYTMNTGEVYFSDYEPISLNSVFALTNSTHIGFFLCCQFSNSLCYLSNI